MNSVPLEPSLTVTKARYLPLFHKPAAGSAFSSLSAMKARRAARSGVMITCARASALIFALATPFAGASPAADVVALRADLTSVIMLLGMPCGQVVSAKRQADNDHIASCSNGDRYRVFVNAQGRVVAQQQ